MYAKSRQEYIIKVCPTDDTERLEFTLNSMSKDGWELYSLHETESDKGLQYSCIFTREAITEDEENTLDDISGFKSQMERMFQTHESPYELCLNLQRKIVEKRDRIQEIKRFLENAAENERGVLNEEISKELEILNSLKKQLNKILSPSKLAKDLGEERISINISEELYPINSFDAEKNLLSETIKIRQELTDELGYILPKIPVIENPSLDENEFTICVHSIPLVNTKAYADCLMFFASDLNIKKLPKGSHRDKDYITGKKTVWIPKEHTKDFWNEGISAAEYIAIYLKYFAIRNVFEIFNYADMNRYIELVSENNSFLVDSVLGDFVSVSELKYIFCQLIRERVSVKDIVYIFEKINDFAEDTVKIDLLDKIRVALSRQISHSLADENKTIYAYEINEKTIRQIEKSAEYADDDDNTPLVKIDGTKFESLIKAISKLSDKENIVLLAPQHLRQVLFALISQLYIDIPVICPEEISMEYELKLEGSI